MKILFPPVPETSARATAAVKASANEASRRSTMTEAAASLVLPDDLAASYIRIASPPMLEGRKLLANRPT